MTIVESSSLDITLAIVFMHGEEDAIIDSNYPMPPLYIHSCIYSSSIHVFIHRSIYLSSKLPILYPFIHLLIHLLIHVSIYVSAVRLLQASSGEPAHCVCGRDLQEERRQGAAVLSEGQAGGASMVVVSQMMIDDDDHDDAVIYRTLMMMMMLVVPDTIVLDSRSLFNTDKSFHSSFCRPGGRLFRGGR